MKAMANGTGGMITVRRRNPVPFIGAGVAFFLYGVSAVIAGLGGIVKAAVLGGIVYFLLRLFFRDRVEQREAAPQTGDVNADQLIVEAREALGRIRAANDAIADVSLSRTIERIEEKTRAILLRLEEKPETITSLRPFLRYYLPTTCKILDARAMLEPGKVTPTDDALQTRRRTENMLGQIDTAFTK